MRTMISGHKSKSFDRKANTRLHVVHGVLSLDVGGLERIVVDLVRTGRQRGHKVSVLCLSTRGLLADAVEEEGGDVICLNKPAGLKRQYISHGAAALAELLPDVLHTHQIGALWYLGSAAKRLGIPAVVHTEHIDNVSKEKNWLRKLKTRMLWHQSAYFSDRFFCVSNDIAASAMRWMTVPPKKVHVILNGIDTERYAGLNCRDLTREEYRIPKAARVIGSVGRLNEVKRQDLLVRAFAKALAEHTDLYLLLVGDGPERHNLELLANQLGICERVRFTGFQKSPERYLAAMDLFALTSRLEGLPLVILEAWAAGLPVISTAVGGVPKVVEDGKSGLLFPSGDEQALLDALRRLLDDQLFAGKLAEEGLAVVRERYSLARMADEYERHYRELMAAA